MKNIIYNFFLLLGILFYQVSAYGQSEVIHAYMRSSFSLDGKWRYIIDPYENGYYDYRRIPFDKTEDSPIRAFYTNALAKEKTDRIEYDFYNSPTLMVPGDWNTQAEELKWYEGTIWYQRDFNYSKKEGKKVFIHFGAINYEAHVYVNGKKVGNHKGGFTPFSFDVTDALEEGKNFVVVKVDNSRKKEAVPNESTDWWNYGGITRSVSLIEVPEIFIQRFKLQLEKGSKNQLKGYVKLKGASSPQGVTIRIPALKIEQKITTDANGLATISINAEDLQLWNTQTPKRYEVQVSTKEDQLTDLIGFRSIEVKGQDILLNGEKIFLKGICVHEENPMEGRRSYSEADARMMFQYAKELNTNFLRLAHYPHNEHVARIADELGILLWEEIPVYWAIDWNNKETLSTAKGQLEELVLRDENRASVIIWSMANETPVKEERTKFLKTLVETARGLDNTRLISAALELHWEADKRILDDPFGQYVDVVSFNQYHGWYGGDLEVFPELKWEIKYDKPVLISEWGGGALHGFHADKETVWSEEKQAYIYTKTLEGVDNIPGYTGMTPWLLFDFRSPRRTLADIQDYWNLKGVVSRGGHKKQAFKILQEYYKKK